MNIILTTPGNIPGKTIKQLADAGCVVIECKRPDEVKTVIPGKDVESNDLLMSALHGIEGDSQDCQKFVKEFNRRLKLKEEKK